MDFNNLLVSIVVITYNSSKYVIQTLESAKAQTYQNIELIISDDCSTDDTVKVCEQWLEKNNNRFIKTKIITTNNNTGIPNNCNRGVKASQGEWIKVIAGDDTLMEACISDNVNFINEHPEAKFAFSLSKRVFGDSQLEEIAHNDIERYVRFSRMNSKEQLHFFLKNSFGFSLPAPTFFFNKEVLTNLGGFDERFKFYEDKPFIIKSLIYYYKWYFLNKYTVNYYIRQDNNSLTNISKKNKVNIKYAGSVIDYNRKVYLKLLIKNYYFLQLHDVLLYILKLKLLSRYQNDKRIPINLIIKIIYFLSPIVIFRKIKKKLL